MRYLDSGTRDPSQALGHWFEEVLREGDVSEVRWQSGFYTADGLGFLAPTLERIREQAGTVVAVIGSNNGDTLRADVARLLRLLEIPRPGALLGVVSFPGAFFHSKTYHLTRFDGSLAAYIGSANLTSAGVGSLHVEAGVLLDTREGDDHHVLTKIAAATDQWFANGGAPGLTVVDSPQVIDRLVTEGVLAEVPSPRAQNHGGAGNTRIGTRARLQPLVRVPPWGTAPLPTPSAPAPGAPSTAAGPVAAIRRAGFPNYLLFDPTLATDPTIGAGALTGMPLPAGAVGLVVRLNRDSARHFAGRRGTANISVPVNTLTTLRFGILRQRYARPRAEFTLLARYIGQRSTFMLDSIDTAVMAYGFAPGEVGHGDIRMLVPSRLRELGEMAQAAGLAVPREGDFALLEWPTATAPEFRLSFLERGSPLFNQAQSLFDAASSNSSLVGDGACWLSPGVSPAW